MRGYISGLAKLQPQLAAAAAQAQLTLGCQSDSQMRNFSGDKNRMEIAPGFAGHVFKRPEGRGGSPMSRRVKEFVDVADHVSIDDLIQKLTAIRDGLAGDADAELRLRGDEVFGHRITITYFREQTPEEAEIEKRYAEEAREAKERELQRLQAELGVVCYTAPGKRGKLRIVA
jgi:hypothetical protein